MNETIQYCEIITITFCVCRSSLRFNLVTQHSFLVVQLVLLLYKSNGADSSKQILSVQVIYVFKSVGDIM
jgi:hypothetical protein